MLKKIAVEQMGKTNQGWLNGVFHFSFAGYYNPNNINFGALRVINDDLIAPGTGFETHPHEDMEIITYVVDGELTHEDSMGNKRALNRGHVQYMSAGTGITHSEMNLGKKVSRTLQIWIFPDRRGYTPNYGDYRFEWDLRKNKWLPIVSGQNGDAPIKINQDVNISALELSAGSEIEFEVSKNRQAYLVQIEGSSVINGIELNERDAMEIKEENILLHANVVSHYLVLEMKKE
jgi:redox-sensitive bicupin YhaK (pirin superfamily)